MTRVEILTIESLKRLANSASGNPRFLVSFTNGYTAPTETDCQVAFTIENSDYQGVPIQVTLNDKNRITYVRPVTS